MSNRRMPHCGKVEDAGAISWSDLLRMSDFTGFARPFRYRVVRDVEGIPIIPGRLGKSRPMTATSFARLWAALPAFDGGRWAPGGSSCPGRPP
jgi:hypothetical protein